jgi:hypothetical protein
MYSRIKISDEHRLKQVVASLNDVKRRGIDVSAWIHSIEVSTSATASEIIDDMICLLLQAKNLRALRAMSSYIRIPITLLAVPAQISSDSLRLLRIPISDELIAADAVMYINSFKRLNNLIIYSLADWSMAKEPLILPNVTCLSFMMYRGRGSTNECTFLLRCRFGAIHIAIFGTDALDVGEGIPFLLDRFLAQQSQIRTLRVSQLSSFSTWQPQAKIPTILLMPMLNYYSILSPGFIAELPLSLRKLTVEVFLENPDPFWSVLSYLLDARTGLEILQIQFSRPDRFTWSSVASADKVQIFIGRLVGYALQLAERGIVITDEDNRSVNFQLHFDS